MSRLNLILVLIVFLISGCTAWKSTKKFYKEYIDPNPKIDLQANGLDNEVEEYFARIFYPVDLQLSEVVSRLNVQDTYPDEAWFEQMLKDFPWLSGVAAIDKDGQVLVRRPAHSVKELEYTMLLTKELRTSDSKIRVCLQDSEFGPEVYLSRPFFKDNQAQGILVVHFDPRSWARLSPSPEEFAIIAEGKLLWAGKYVELGKLLTQINRTELLKDGVFGQLEIKNRSFYWFSRPVEENWFIYLMAESKGG
ncbi:hypothetical protein [Desulfovulcanus sp.]